MTMCNFFSAIALKNGDILWHPMVDSHSELIEYFKLPDTRSYHQHFAKCELSPTQDDEAHWMDPQQWTFKLDEETAPSWWPDVAAKVEASMRDKAARMILKDDSKPLILDGCWIVGGNAKIREIRSGRIVRILGGTVSAILGGTVSAIRSGTVSAILNGTVSAICPSEYCTLNLSDQARAELLKCGVLKA